MNKLKVNINQTRSELKKFDIESLSLSGTNLVIELADAYSHRMVVGDRIFLIRSFEDENVKSVSSISNIIAIIDDKRFIISGPTSRGDIHVRKNYDEYEAGKPCTIYASSDTFVFNTDIGATKDHLELNSYTITASNSKTGYKKVIDDFYIYSDEQTNRIICNLTEEEYNTINNSAITLSFSNGPFIVSEKNKKDFHLWSEYTNKSDINLYIEESYIRVPLLLSNNSDEKHLLQEENLNEIYENDYKENVIPESIDYEKVKLIPTYNNWTENVINKNFILHFRSRAKDSSGNYEDGWYIKNLEDMTSADTLWNAFEYVSDIDKSSSAYGISDSLYYLGFTDEDVYYQKNRIKKSFIRLSYYTSKDPLSQMLLGYSTVFMDTKDLFGAYIKLVNLSAETPYVATSAITSEFSITNYFNDTKSSDGFYLYLFKKDFDNEDLFEIKNNKKTIYMKVEFNHAGYGRTIPMVVWPFVNGSPVNLTVDNYYDQLYIPVYLNYINNEYVFEIDKDYIYKDENYNENIVLFEPFLGPVEY